MRKGGTLVDDPLPWWEKYVVRSGIPALGIRTAHIRALAGYPTSTRTRSTVSWLRSRSPKG
jgi:hypothetical protein